MKSNLFKNLLSGLAFGCVFTFMASVNTANAQEINKIQEIQLKNDGFNTFRSLISQNFNFSNEELPLGVTNSNVKFDVLADGKIANVHAKGQCKDVDKALEEVIAGMLYRLDTTKIGMPMASASYVMPVSVEITER